MSHTTSFTTAIYSSVAEINSASWEAVRNGRNVYFSFEYLSALEQSSPLDVELFYTVTLDSEKKPVLIGVFQLVTFVYKKHTHKATLLKPFSDDKDDQGNFALNMLVCGNAFSDGENGFLWKNTITPEEAVQEITSAAKKIKKQQKTHKEISVLLFKEFWPSSATYSKLLKEYKYTDFNIDVNMVLQIHKDWISWDAYLKSMKAKYRTKANAAFKRSRMLEIRSLQSAEIKQHQSRIETLYSNVLEKSDYSFGNLKPQTFSAFKNNLGDSFSFRAAFFEDQLIGFSTAFIHNDIMEATYVGIDYDYNTERAVYQRLLYDYVQQAIDAGVKELQLGRTSELIKSSLGAEPVHMTLYAKHKTPLSHLLMSSILSFVSPSKFELRQPFKADFNLDNE